MVVKSKRGRRRYVVFRVRDGGTLTDEALLSALNPPFLSAQLRPPKVIQFDGSTGIVRVGGDEHRKAVEVINAGGQGALETLRTSGTLRTLRERYFPAPSKDAERA